MSWLVKPREHLEPMVIVALGLGLRKQEQLKLRRDQVDFFTRQVALVEKNAHKSATTEYGRPMLAAVRN